MILELFDYGRETICRYLTGFTQHFCRVAQMWRKHRLEQTYSSLLCSSCLVCHVKDVIRNHLRLPRQPCWCLIGKGIRGRSGSAWARICHLEVILLTRQEARWPFLIMCLCPGTDALGKQFNQVNRVLTESTPRHPNQNMWCNVRVRYDNNTPGDNLVVMMQTVLFQGFEIQEGCFFPHIMSENLLWFSDRARWLSAKRWCINHPL